MASGIFNKNQVLQGLAQGAWSGNVSSNAPKQLEYLIVAGGGGGGRRAGGGGGAGGLIQGLTNVTPGASLTVTVGSGGAGATGDSSASSTGNPSVFYNVSTKGGGGGASFGASSSAGGSGGGGSSCAYPYYFGAQGTYGQGNAGGIGTNFCGGTDFDAGGGGGAGTPGSNGTKSYGGNGGTGIASSISGISTTYAGGGGGGDYGGTAGLGGVGGGGAGGLPTPSNGSTNSGGGGGGSGYTCAGVNGGSGGSGIVITRYPGNTQYYSGGTLSYDSVNNYTVHSFYSSGTLTPLATPVTYGTTNQLTKSLRFRRSNTAFLNRTPASSTNTTTWTWSGWVKKGLNGVQGYLFGTQSSTPVDGFYFDSDNTIQFRGYNGSLTYQLITSALFVDTSAWYHVVVSFNSNAATASERAKIYINGVQATLSTASYPSQGYTSSINTTAYHAIGEYAAVSSTFFDGEMAEINFIDGQALTPKSFGLYDPTSGVWSPMAYQGTYGTNGFYLPFTNTTSTTTLGYDTSGNGNNWSTSGFSLTSGATYDSMNDVPTLTNATASNYAVLNSLLGNANLPSNGNLSWNRSTVTSHQSILNNFGVTSGKWYAEFTISSFDAAGIGITTIPTIFTSYPGGTANLWWMYDNGGTNYIYNQTTGASTSTRFTNGQIIQIALDMNTGNAWIGINNTYYSSNNTSTGNPSSGTNPSFSSLPTSSPMFVFLESYDSNWSANFGQQPFSYTPPTGFLALNTYNLPTPAIVKPNQYFDASLYNGNGGTNVIMNAGSFKPDLVWYKSRSSNYDHSWFDSIRGSTKQLVSDLTQAETTLSGVTAFNSNGFTLGTDANGNNNNSTYVGWQWQAGSGSSGSNTNGTITSVVSANPTAGFSIVTYTGTGSNATVGHGLGVTPSMVIVKKRSSTGNWPVYHSALTSASYDILLNTTGAQNSASAVWNNTTPTSSVFSIGTDSDVNASSATYVAYVWAAISGFSAFGSYTGNGSSTGPFVYLGFKPTFVLVKCTNTATGDWTIWDNKRNPYNTVNITLEANANSADYTSTSYNGINFLSNGFQLVGTDAGVNGSSDNYIYLAFASNPFKYSNAF
jgi:hypothetical protein